MSRLRKYVLAILTEAPRWGKRHDIARSEQEELASQGIFPTEEEKPERDKRDLWHIGPHPAQPQPKMTYLQQWDPKAIDPDTREKTGDMVNIPDTDNWQRWWLDSTVKSGVFLTPTPTDIARYHGRSGNVYHYKVPEWVIDKAKGIHRYDHGSEVLISNEIWKEAGDEIEFVGTSMTKDQLWQKIRDLGGYDFGGRGKPSGKSKPGSFNLGGLRQTKHPRDAVKLMTDDERKAALAALKDLYPTPAGQNPEIKWEKVPGSRRGIPLNWFEERIPPKDRELMSLLSTPQKSVNEEMIRQYVRDMLFEKVSDGRTLDRVTQVKMDDDIPQDLLALGNEDPEIEGFVYPEDASKKRAGIYIGDDLVGFMTPREEPDGGWRVGAIYIRPENRGKGIAPLAIAKFFEDKNASPVPIGLANSSSQSAFAKAGFTPLDPDKVLTDESDGWKYQLWGRKNAKRSTAVIIKGNPDYISDHNDFYEEIKSFLEGLGYEVSFDEGAPMTSPPKADLWIGHSRGSDRLEGAVPEYAKAVLAIGVPDPANQHFPTINHPKDQPEVGKKPNKYHFVFTDKMKNKIKEISNETPT